MRRYFFFTGIKRRNPGYTEREDGTRCSLRAYYAEDEGKYTAGKFRTVYGVSKKVFDALVMIGIIVTKEWHHTGKSYTKNDFYEWEDEEFLSLYDTNKEQIATLAKQLDTATWEYRKQEYICHIEDYEMFKNYTIYDQIDLMLTPEELQNKEREHKVISNSADAFDSRTRYEMHKKVDAKYFDIANTHLDEDSIKEAYEKKWGESIRLNAERTKNNAEIKAYNLATNGRENILMQIASFFFDDTDLYDDVYKACEKAKDAERVLELEKEREAKAKAYKEAQAEADKKQGEYLNKCIKSGKATQYVRINESDTDDLCVTTLKEMNGKYGWFKSKIEYNLTEYHTGYRFADKRTKNHYLKLGIIKNEPQP